MASENNVYSSAKIVKTNEGIQDYQLGTFLGTDSNNQTDKMKTVAPLKTQAIPVNVDAVLAEMKNLQNQMLQISGKITTLENKDFTGGSKDIDKQVVGAIKDLKHYASFFEQATFQMETKILRTSISIAQKIIGIEVGENSANIAKATISSLLLKIKTASKVTIHLNPKDYAILIHELNLESFIELYEDENVKAGGVVIASDLGNYDGNIEVKVASMLESLDTVV